MLKVFRGIVIRRRLRLMRAHGKPVHTEAGIAMIASGLCHWVIMSMAHTPLRITDFTTGSWSKRKQLAKYFAKIDHKMIMNIYNLYIGPTVLHNNVLDIVLERILRGSRGKTY